MESGYILQLTLPYTRPYPTQGKDG
jgi:hypothetical protein